MRDEAFVWSCQGSCEKPRKSFKKGGTESDLPFRKFILEAGRTTKGVSHSQVGWWQRWKREVRGQTTEIRKENGQDLAID